MTNMTDYTGVGRYEVAIVPDNFLPAPAEWMLVSNPESLMLAVKRSAVSEELLEEAWAAWLHSDARKALDTRRRCEGAAPGAQKKEKRRPRKCELVGGQSRGCRKATDLAPVLMKVPQATEPAPQGFI